MNIIELFAGSRSVGNESDALGFNVFSCDWKAFDKIDYVGDIENLRKEDVPFIPDIVWASPDCATYSIAAISHHRENGSPKSEYAAKCDRVNKHFLELIKNYLSINKNLVYFIENPVGYFRKMPFVNEFLEVTLGKRQTVWYCQYGDKRAKPTDIFTNSLAWTPRPVCKNGNPMYDVRDNEISNLTGVSQIRDLVFEACDLVQAEQQKRIADSFKSLVYSDQVDDIFIGDFEKMEASITNPENLIK